MDSGAIIIGGAGQNGGVGGRPGTDAGQPPPMDAGFNMCTANTPCTANFTCDMTCNVGGVTGVRPCTCGNNGRLNCPGGMAGCQRDAGPPPPMPDAGFNMCTANTPCTMGFACAAVCNVGGVAGTRACTCGNNGMLNCPGGNVNCIRPDAGPPPPTDAARPDVPPPVDAPRDVPAG